MIHVVARDVHNVVVPTLLARHEGGRGKTLEFSGTGSLLVHGIQSFTHALAHLDVDNVVI